jgi:hypothetical protein
VQKPRSQEPFWGREDQSVASGDNLFFGFARGLGRHATVEGRCGIPTFAEAVDLILHQGNERRDDNIRPLCQLGGNLVAQGLAASRRQDDKRISPFETCTDGLLLEQAQLVISPVLVHRGEDISGCPLC